MSDSRRPASILKSGAGSMGVSIAHAALGFLTTVLLARLLSVDDFGLYSYAFAIASLLIVPAQFGFPDLLMRETARFHAAGKHPETRAAFMEVNRIILVFATLVVGVGCAGAMLAARPMFSSDPETFYLALVLIPLIALGTLRAATLRGMGYVVRGLLPELVLRPLIFVMLLSSWALLASREVSSQMAMGLHVLGALGAFLIGALMLRAAWPTGDASRREPTKTTTKEWLRGAAPIGIADLVSGVYINIGVLVLGVFAALGEVGSFRIALQLSALVAFSLVAVERVIAPITARLHAQDKMHELERIAVIAAQAVSVAALALALVFVFGGRYLLAVLFGAEYEGGYHAVVILSFAQVVAAATGASAVILVMSGNAKAVAITKTCAAVAATALSFLLIPPMGLDGAALAMGMSLVAWKICLAILVQRRLAINCTALNLGHLGYALRNWRSM